MRCHLTRSKPGKVDEKRSNIRTDGQICAMNNQMIWIEFCPRIHHVTSNDRQMFSIARNTICNVKQDPEVGKNWV